jgi:hypothetical protein
MRSRRLAPQGALVLLAALLSGGCAFTHHCEVPTPVVEVPPGHRHLPLSRTVRYLPGKAAPELARPNSVFHTWIIDADPPTRALFDRLAASLAGPAEAPPAAVLEIRLEQLDFSFVNPILGPYQASVGYRATLRAPGGAELASYQLTGAVDQPVPWELGTHCSGLGRAVARAMQGAGTGLLEHLDANPGLLPEGAAPEVAVAAPPPVEPPAAPPPLPAPDRAPPPPPEATPPPPPPVVAGPAMPRRAMQLLLGLGAVLPDHASNLLVGGDHGSPSLRLAVEYRFTRFVAFAFEGGTEWRRFGPDNMPSGGFFGTASGVDVGIGSIGAGLRAFWPGEVVEPWGGFLLQLVSTKLANNYAVLGMPGWTSSAAPGGTDTSPTLELQGGLRLYPGGHWTFGLEGSRRSATATFSGFPGTIQLGGWGARLVLGYLFY